MSKIGREGTTRTTTRITQKNDLVQLNTKNKKKMEPATISAASNVASATINAIAQGAQNRKTRKWNEAMYGKQREDALADWARTNEYNAPLQQMARLKEAGLSPHLIYGGGANSISSPVRSTDVKSWNPTAPQIDGGQIVSQYFGVKQQQLSLQILQGQKDSIDLKNEYDRRTMPDRTQTPGLTNARTTEQIDNIMEDTRMSRLKQTLQPGEYNKLQEEVKQLVTNNQYNELNQQSKLALNGYMQEQLQLINKGLINKNDMSQIEAKWKSQIDQYVGPASGLTQSIIKILLTAMTR